MQPLTILLPVLYAIFLWWFITGLVIALYGRSRPVVGLFFVGATLVTCGALVVLRLTDQASQPRDVYLALTCGVVIWGWHTASYYLGFVTGPRIKPVQVDEHLSLIDRLRLALRASLYHELFIVATGLLLLALTWTHANRWGLWIFLALWLMHLSAKLNVFLGVRNFRIDFLPAHLHHLNALIYKRPDNAFLPISVLVASSLALVMVYRAIIPDTLATTSVGLLFTATMVTLGIIEHLLLVLPLPAMLWGWSLRPLSNAKQPQRPLPKQRTLSINTLSEQIVEGSSQ